MHYRWYELKQLGPLFFAIEDLKVDAVIFFSNPEHETCFLHMITKCFDDGNQRNEGFELLNALLTRIEEVDIICQ